MAGATLTIAIAALAFIAGTLGAWLVYTDLRDSKRRFDARQRLGLEPYGDVIRIPPQEYAPGSSKLGAGGRSSNYAPRRTTQHDGDAI